MFLLVVGATLNKVFSKKEFKISKENTFIISHATPKA